MSEIPQTTKFTDLGDGWETDCEVSDVPPTTSTTTEMTGVGLNVEELRAARDTINRLTREHNLKLEVSEVGGPASFTHRQRLDILVRSYECVEKLEKVP